jgi:uncharacterized protein
LLLALACLLLAAIGVVLPGLPTTPFVLVAAWAAARGSARLHRWLHQHRLFGPMIHDWEAERAVSRRAKLTALATMLLCALVLLVWAPQRWVVIGGIVSMTVVGAWLWRRPEPGGRP